MPNQDMLDRMPEVSQNTLHGALAAAERTLADQVRSAQQALEHEGCHQRISALEAEAERLRKALTDIASYTTDNPGDHTERARAALAQEEVAN